MELHIRQANITDAEALAQLGAKTFYDTFHMHQSEEDMRKYLEYTYTTEKVKANLENPDVMYYLATDQHVPVGYVKLILNVAVEQMPGARVWRWKKFTCGRTT